MKLAKVFLAVLMGFGFVGCGDHEPATVKSANKYKGIWASEAMIEADQNIPLSRCV